MKMSNKAYWWPTFCMCLALLAPIAWVLMHPASYGEVILASAIGGGDAVVIDILWKNKP